METNSSVKKAGGINSKYSPFGEKSREAAKRRFTKRKSSKSLLDMFERESISMLENEVSDSSFCAESSEVVVTATKPQLSKRFKEMATMGGDCENFKFIDWGENANAAGSSLATQISPPLDWDDSAARSAFDSPFSITNNKETALNKRISNLYPLDFSHLNNAGPSAKAKRASTGSAKSTSAHLPKDLRLATKLRLVSERPFPWLEKISTPGEYPPNAYISPSKFEKAMDLNIDTNTTQMQGVKQESAPALVCLQSAAIFHQFPSIGPVQMFPRRNLGSKSALKSANLQSIEANFMDELNQQWSGAFSFLFHRWLAHSSESFYLCAPQFTVLFVNLPAKPGRNSSKTPQKKNRLAENSPRKGSLARTPLKNGNRSNQSSPFGSPLNSAKSPCSKPGTLPATAHFQHLVVVTPTSTGFRQTLHKNGVRFCLPLKAEFVDLGRGEECPRDFLPTEEDGTAQLDQDEWLRDIGISPRSTLRLKRSTSELDAPPPPEGESSTGGSSRVPTDVCARRSGSGTPPTDASRSTVLIRGPKDAANFFKLLSSQPQLVGTRTGPQTGLPPTLLCHSPFRHSAQKELSMNSQLIKKCGQSKYVLELDQGAILPRAVELLVEFVAKMSSSSSAHSSSSSARVQIQLNGRNQCNGMNEALAKEAKAQGLLLANFSELEWDGQKRAIFEYSG